MNSTSSLSIFKSLGIRGRLFLGFALLIIPIIIVTVIFLIKINSLESFTKRMADVIVPTQGSVVTLDTHIYETELAQYDWLFSKNPSAKTNFNNIWDNIEQTKQGMITLSSGWNNPDFLRRWETLKTLYQPLKEVQTKIMNSEALTDVAIKQLIETEEKPLIKKMMELIRGDLNSANDTSGMFENQEAELSQGATIMLEDMVTLQIMAYILLGITLFLAFIVPILTASKILEPVKSFRRHSSRIAQGDLTQRLNMENKDEMGSLGHDLNIMTDSLATITKKITEASNNMSVTLEEVKHAAEMQSTGVSEQASSINEITASLEEIDKSATQTMEKAKILGQISEKTSEKGQKGLEAVEQSIEGMNAIREKVQIIAKTILELSNQTQQVGEITAVVNTLALQSKMLALNASIEASKAGDAGKGFAVVAAEVKNLAEQSAQSTTQVQKILEDIRHGTEQAVLVTEEGTKGVDEGTQIVEQMGEIVRSLTEAINETMIASQQIEAAVRQESLGIEQITAGMNEINQVTSSFVNTVKQTTESIQHLSQIANNIKEYVDVYRV